MNLELPTGSFKMEKKKINDGTVRYRESYYVGSKRKAGPWFRKISDAKTWKNRIETTRLTRLAQGEHYVEVQHILFKDYANHWMNTYVKTSCVHRTFEGYESVLRAHLIPRFGETLLRDITEEDGLMLIQKLKETHKARGIQNIWQVLRAILIKAYKERLIPVNPLMNVKLPRPDLKLHKFWVQNEITKYLTAPSTEESLIYHISAVAIQTGLRLAELCGLCWDRVDFRRNLIHVTRTRDKTGVKDSTKNKLSRIIPMTAMVRALLTELFDQRDPDCDFVFLGKKGGPIPYGHIYRQFGIAQADANIKNKIRFHDLRHTFASNYMMSGGNVFDLQKLLGHTKIEMTMVYAHLSPNHLQGSLRFMGGGNDLQIESNNDFRTVIEPRGESTEKNLRIIES
jgi:integrase